MSFSERQGIVPSRTQIQVDDFDRDTRMAIWNVVAILPKVLDIYGDHTEHDTLTLMWTSHFKEARDERPFDSAIWRRIKSSILEDPYNLVLDAVEALCEVLYRSRTPRTQNASKSVINALNASFERYLVAYRFIDG